MRLTVLGRWSPYPPPGGACSGYLVEAGGRYILLDSGPGVLANLQRLITVFDLAAVVITHLHTDHVLDLFTIESVLKWGWFPRPAPPLRLFAPPDAIEVLPSWMGEGVREDFENRFFFLPIVAGTAARLGPFVLRFAVTTHTVPCFAVRVEAEGRVLTYSADTGPSDEVAALARDAHVFICENTLRMSEEEQASRLGHLSARLAGGMAARADAGRLLLTHFFTPHGDYAEEAREAAAKEFGREILIAREMESHEV